MSDQTRQAFLEDLWRRNVPDKTVRLELKNGQTIVTKRVFQKKTAPKWAFYDCTVCRRVDAVCRKHQFCLVGPNAVRHYVDSWLRSRSSSSATDVDTTKLSSVLMNLNLASSVSVDLECQETADRVDVMDEYFAKSRELFNDFRLRRSDVFYRDTGIHLPLCCKFPQSNLYRAYRDYHQHA